MDDMTSIVLIIIIVLLACALLIERRRYTTLHTALGQDSMELDTYKRLTEIIFQNVHAFILLIDTNFVVKKTNYYTQTSTLSTFEPKKVGDLLHCNNALSAEKGCGTHPLCSKCPIRHAIQHAFDTKSNFENLEGGLTILEENGRQKNELFALISGTYITIKGEGHIVLTIHDITKLKKIEQSLIDAKHKAEESNRSKSIFLANMSHEIRTPLNAIIGFAEVLANAKTEEEKKQFQEIIQSNGDLLLQLVNDILDMSKIEAGTMEFVYSEVDVNILMLDLLQFFKMKLKNQESNVQLFLEKGADTCTIKTDRNRLSQLVTNFLTNAIKYTKEGTITMGYQVKPDEVYFYVRDTGIGIPEEKLPKLFERFYQVDKTHEGNGLGLSICKTIIEKFGGNIGADSVVGKGSTFWFTIPTKIKK